MPHGGYHGVVKMGGKVIQQGSSSDGQGGQTGGGVYNPGGYANEFDTGQAGDASDIIDKGLSPTNPKDAEIINALNVQEETPVVDKKEITGLPDGGILQALYGDGAGSIEGYDPEDIKYNLEGQHPLSQQFVRLADKYYGGDQEAFAQSSQGQVLLNYLQDVPYTKGGLMGALDENLREKIDKLDLPMLQRDVLMGEDYEPFKTKNVPISDIRMQPDLNRFGPLTSEDYRKFSEYLSATRPDLMAKARPWSSGKLPASVVKFLISPSTEFGKGIVNSLLGAAGKDPLKEKEPFKGIATDNQFIDQLNYEGFGPGLSEEFPINPNLSSLIQPLDTDQGGMNDVAQAVINQNKTPVIDPALDPSIIAQLLEENLPESGIINAFDPDSLAFSMG